MPMKPTPIAQPMPSGMGSPSQSQAMNGMNSGED
jgi:hypothetical protein